MSRRSLDLWPRRSFSWQRRRNPNSCASPTLNPPFHSSLGEGPLGALQAVAFQTSTVASAAVVECTPPKKPPFFVHTLTHTRAWVSLPPCVFPHMWFKDGLNFLRGEKNLPKFYILLQTYLDICSVNSFKGFCTLAVHDL